MGAKMIEVRLKTAVLFATALSGLGMIVAFNPENSNFFPPCPFHHATGFYCPGCGSTRAIHKLFHGQFVDAISLNPLMVLSIPLLIVMAMKPAWIYWTWVPWLSMTILIVYGVVRNIPIWPFILLSPN